MGLFALLMVLSVIFVLVSGIVMIVLEELERRKIIEI